MIAKITKYKTSDNEEFNSYKDAENYEKTLVDKNGKKLKIGDIIKESWFFHGFRSDLYGHPEEWKNGQNKSFRFVVYDGSQRFNINRVNNQGWPVSEYEIEIVSPEEVEKIKNSHQYVSTEYVKYSHTPYYYRLK